MLACTQVLPATNKEFAFCLYVRMCRLFVCVCGGGGGGGGHKKQDFKKKPKIL